jgi:hypothetical protein
VTAQLFPVITVEMMSAAIAKARAIGVVEGNQVLTQIRAAMATITLQRAASRAGRIGVSAPVLGARFAASTFPAGPLPSNDRKEVRTLERL